MNDQNLLGQISNCLVKGRFKACVLHQDSGEKKQLGVPELIRLSMKKNVPPPLVAEKALDNAMEESIKKYVDGEFTLPDMIVRAKSTAKARDVHPSTQAIPNLSPRVKLSLPLLTDKTIPIGRALSQIY